MDVVVWLRSLGLGKYEALFRENDIDETVSSGPDAREPEGAWRHVAWSGRLQSWLEVQHRHAADRCRGARPVAAIEKSSGRGDRSWSPRHCPVIGLAKISVFIGECGGVGHGGVQRWTRADLIT